MSIPDDRALQIAIDALAVRAERIAQERRYRKNLVRQMHEQGHTVAYIAEFTGLKPGTVSDYINRREEPRVKE